MKTFDFFSKGAQRVTGSARTAPRRLNCRMALFAFNLLFVSALSTDRKSVV